MKSVVLACLRHQLQDHQGDPQLEPDHNDRFDLHRLHRFQLH